LCKNYWEAALFHHRVPWSLAVELRWFDWENLTSKSSTNFLEINFDSSAFKPCTNQFLIISSEICLFWSHLDWLILNFLLLPLLCIGNH
jgi:hypothetical protein